MDPITVPVGDCRCPGTPHEQDEVYLAAELGLTAGLAVEAAMNDSKPEDQNVAVSLALIHHNIVGWSFLDEKGPVPFRRPDGKPDVAAIERLLPYARGGEAVANKAAGLYIDSFLVPLAARVSARSQTSRTNGTTRPLLASRKPSQRKRGGSSSRAGSAGTQ